MISILNVENIHTYYGESHILQGVNTRVQRGVVAVIGRNGVGKTTLVYSIIGLMHPREGRIVFRGEDITHLPAYKIARQGIRVVPQGRRVFSSLTLKQTLEIALCQQEGSKWSIDRVLSMFPRLKDRLASRAGELSGGEQQMLSIGRALLGNPDFLIADEPTEGLSPMVVEELGHILIGLKTQGLSILLAEQNLQFTLRLADYIYVMSKGKIVYESSPEEFRENEEIKHMYLGV